MKTCVKCGSTTTSHWYAGPICRTCWRKRPKYYLKKKEDNKIYYRKKGFGTRLKREYWPHLTRDEAIEEYTRLLNLQGEKCAICRKPESAVDPKSKIIKRLSVDHCHKTGKIRGLLCNQCNKAIGLLKDDVAVIDNMKAYLHG